MRILGFLAGVLFLVGIGSTFKVVGVRDALVTLGTSLLVRAVVLLWPRWTSRIGRRP